MKFKPNKLIQGHNPVSHGGLYSIKNPDSKIIDFSSNVNPLGPPPGVKKYLKKNINSLEVYPDSESTKLRKNLSWYTKVPANKIVVGNGATEIIYNFCNAFLNKITPVLIPVPTFGEYEAAAKLSGCKVSFFKTMNLSENLDLFLKKIPKNGCIFLCNPNNPTGLLLSRKTMLKILQNAKKKSTFVFVDECFIELSDHITVSMTAGSSVTSARATASYAKGSAGCASYAHAPTARLFSPRMVAPAASASIRSRRNR